MAAGTGTDRPAPSVYGVAGAGAVAAVIAWRRIAGNERISRGEYDVGRTRDRIDRTVGAGRWSVGIKGSDSLIFER